MKHVKALSGVALALLLAAGCSVETGDSLEALENGEVNETGTVADYETTGLPSDAELAEGSRASILAMETVCASKRSMAACS